MKQTNQIYQHKWILVSKQFRGHHFNLFFLALFMLFFSACNLEEEIFDKAITDGFVKVDSDIPFVVNGVYNSYQEWALYKSSAYTLLFYCGDDFSSSNVSYAGNYLTRGYNSTDNYIRYTWVSLFGAINRANSAIYVVNNAPNVKPETKLRVEGEMRFMRAFSYFNLVRFFGGVPIRYEQTTPNSNFYERRKTVDEVYQFIFEDLKFASNTCLPYSKQPAVEFGRATKGAAQAILSLAYLTYGNYLEEQSKSHEAQVHYEYAVNYADSVILSEEYQLLPNFADLFDVTKEKIAYTEVIFGIQFTRDGLTSGAASKGSELAYQFQPTTRYGICGNAPLGKGGAQAKLQPWFVEQYYTGDYGNGMELDYRTEYSFLTKWVGTTSTTASPTPSYNYVCFPEKPANATDKVETEPYLNKYKDPDGFDNRNHENDLYIIRLAEVCLIKAEALNEIGKTDEAYIPFNKVRERARMTNGTPRNAPLDLEAGLSKDDFRLAIFNERGLELVGEGHRFFDAVRMQYKSTGKCMLQWRMEDFYGNMSAAQKKLPIWDKTNNVWSGGRVQPISTSTWNDRYKLAPIPATEMAANPNFGDQNPGW